MYTFVDITTLFSRRMSALVNSEDLMILLTLKKKKVTWKFILEENHKAGGS